MSRLSNFFSGRYGVDKLFNAMTMLAVILAFINIFIRSTVLQVIVYAILIVAIARAMSRNREKRYAENEKFLSWQRRVNSKLYTLRQKLAPVKSKLTLLKRMWKDRKTHCYFKCDNCKKVLRLPKKKGTHTVKCPNCSHSFQVKV
jgi:DNA-directed RNA polymerase subunit RPC12/RpoP